MSRHDRRKNAAQMRSMDVPANPRTRVMRFIGAFHEAPNDADIEIRTGSLGAAEAAVLVTINGSAHGLTTKEARAVADIMEEAMRTHPEDPEGATLPNIIMGLRAGCDAAEQDNPARHGL